VTKRFRYAAAAAALAVTAAAVTYVVARDCSPEAQILAAIRNNLTKIDSLTANMSCTCSNDALSFTDGFLYLKGSEKIAIWRGASNSQVWCNDTCFNVADPIDGKTYGYLWNDTSNAQWLFWAVKIGYVDPRVALGAATQATDLELATGTEVVNDVTCYKLSSSGQRLWVGCDNSAHVIRWEYDYSDGSLACRADYAGWATVGDADLPNQLTFEVFDGDGTSWHRFEYSLSNIQVSASVDDGLFNIWVPPDTSTLP